MTKLLMVCMSNICRSPMAQAISLKLADAAGNLNSLLVDSAGTHAPFLAERPDPRAQATLTRHGYEVGRSRSRRIELVDFDRYDLILAMDAPNLEQLHRICPPAHAQKLHLLMSFSSVSDVHEIPDPYYGNAEGFERVLALCEAGSRGLLRHLLEMKLVT